MLRLRATVAMIGLGLTLALSPASEPALGAPAAQPFRVEVAAGGAPPVSLYGEEMGAGPVVLLLHGLGELTFTWRHVLPGLADRFRVIALDLKGFGRSDKPEDDAYGADDQAALVADFLDRRGLDAVTLVGHSFGGNVALATALKLQDKPGRIARLVLISAPAVPQAIAGYMDLVDVPALPEVLASQVSPELLARVLLREARGGRGEVPAADVEGYAAPYRDDDAKRAFLATARAIVGVRKAAGLVESYRALRQPALVVWCRDDPIVPLRAGRALAKALPRSELAVLEGCHHLPQDETPAGLVDRLIKFLDRK